MFQQFLNAMDGYLNNQITIQIVFNTITHENLEKSKIVKYANREEFPRLELQIVVNLH